MGQSFGQSPKLRLKRKPAASGQQVSDASAGKRPFLGNHLVSVISGIESPFGLKLSACAELFAEAQAAIHRRPAEPRRPVPAIMGAGSRQRYLGRARQRSDAQGDCCVHLCMPQAAHSC
ncbi:unnamed protein product [Symbiodinium microadriaticum]|nr:unnamed protein product [Symbiodinium microadriaticum]